MERFIDPEYKRGIDLETEQSITIERLQRIYDQSLSKSNNRLIDSFNQLQKVDVSILTDPVIINHKFYSFIINKLRDLLILWDEQEHLTGSDSDLFHHIIKLLCKIKLSPNQLIPSVENCLKQIANKGKFLNDKNNIESFSNLVGLYTQNEEIIEAIVQCLCSKYYLEMFQSIDNENFLLIKFPTYFRSYQGLQREELSNILLNSLLVFSANILKNKSIQQWNKPLTELIYLLHHSLTLCEIMIFKNDLWIDIIKTLLSLLNEELMFKERKSLIRSITYLILILINNEEKIYQYIKEYQDKFDILIETNNETCLILTSFIDDSQIQTIIDNNKNFVEFLREFLKESNNEENIRITSFIKRLKKFINNEDEISLQLQSMIVSNENKNQEQITLIWFDKNIEDTKRTVELLQQINDYVLICSDHESFIRYIEQIKTEKVFLIISGSNVEEILEEIHYYKQIDSIFIFCMISEKYQIYLNNAQFYKVIGIYTEYQPLLFAIQENIRYLIKQSEATGLFDQEERSMRNLNRESYTFNYVLLKTTYNNDIAKREMIEICRNYYRNNKKELLDINEFEQTYQSKDAIYWYIKQSFVYRLVNKALRTKDYAAILPLRFFIHDLSKDLREKYQDLKQHFQTIVTYRGLKLPSSEIHHLKHNIDTVIRTNGFLSTSRSKDIAYKFAKKAAKCPEFETVMLEITVDLSKVTAALADVSRYSDYPEEQEILFDLGASFTIDSVNYDSIQKVWFVKLEAQSQEFVINDIQIVLKPYRLENDMNIFLGKLLFKMEKYDICQKYFENLLNCYKKYEYESLAKIYNFIGYTSSRLKDYDKAIINYTKAFEYYTLLNHREEVARTVNMIGLQYACKNDINTARFHYEQSHELWKELPIYTSKKPNCEIGRLMCCFGEVEDNNQLAYNYFLKALKIYQNPSETCEHNDHDLWIGIQYEMLANRYYNDNDYKKAFDYIMKCILIRKQHISTVQMRLDYLSCLETLREICRKVNENVWLEYENEYIQLLDIENFQLYSESKHSLDSVNTIKRTDFNHEDVNNNTSMEFLEYSLKSLKYLLKTNPDNYQKIIQAHMDIGLAYRKTTDYLWSSQHYQTAVEMCQEYLPNDSKHISTIYEILSEISLERNDIDQAFSFRMKSLSINEKSWHLSEKENEAQCYFDLGNQLLALDLDQALEVLFKSLDIRHEILPSNHITTGFCYESIATAYNNKFILNFAIEYYIKAIEIYKKYLSDKIDYQFNLKQCYIRCQSNLVRIYCQQQNYDEALIYKMKIFNFDERYSHLTDQEKESQCYYDFGTDLLNYNICKAMEFYRKSLEIREQIFPSDHVNIGLCCQSIGEIYEKKSLFNKALEYYLKATKIYEKHLFNQDLHEFDIRKNYIQCLWNLARSYCVQENYEEAFVYKMKVFSFDEKYSHLTEKEKEAQCYYDFGTDLFSKDIDRALEFYQKSLQIREDILPFDHVHIGICHHHIATAFEEKSSSDKAFEHFIKATQIYEKHIFDSDTYEFNIKQFYGDCCINIATCYLNMNKCDYIYAMNYTLKALQIFQEYCPENRKGIAHCYWNYGYILIEKGEYNEAIVQIQKSLVTSFNDNSIDMGLSYHLLGGCYYRKFEYEQALSFFEIALKFYEEDLTNLNDENIAYVLSDIAECLFKLKQYERALEYGIQAMQIMEEILPLIHVYKALLHGLLALIYCELLENDRCNEHSIKALEISKQLISKNETMKNLAYVFENFGQLYVVQNNFEEAQDYFKKALKFIKEEKMNDHPDISRIQNIIDELLDISTNNSTIFL